MAFQVSPGVLVQEKDATNVIPAVATTSGGIVLTAEKGPIDEITQVTSENELVETFGKNAIIVLSGYGVGADTGARILRNMTDQDLMYKQIYEAERQYVMTRGFWDD